MKKKLICSIALLTVEISFKNWGLKVMQKGGRFQLFPYYWELIPLRLEKALICKKSMSEISTSDDYRLRGGNIS
jgi:hypothetical protein